MTVTVGTLIGWLSVIPKDTPVIVLKDSEGNGAHKVSGVSLEYIEDIDAYDIELVSEEDIDEDELDDYKEVVALW